MHTQHLLSLFVSVPPLEEQKRIVTKVDRLMSLYDELEAQQEKAAEERDRLVASALDGLLSAEDADRFAARWRLIAENFDLLFDMPEHVEKLRAAILQLAVQGKLVRQDANDEPASELLKRIQLEKADLIKKKKIKRAKPLPPIAADEVPYDLPSGWEWVRLGEVTNYAGGHKVSSDEIPDDAWLLDLADIEKDTSRIVQRAKFKDRRSKSTKAEFAKGDVLYGKLRPYLNKVVLADNPGFCTTEIVPIKTFLGIFPKYLMYALKCPDFLAYVDSKTYGVKMPRLGTQDAVESLFSLPPLEEQKRIVAKVDQFMTLCDQLEAHLKSAQEDGEKLLAAAVNA